MRSVTTRLRRRVTRIMPDPHQIVEEAVAEMGARVPSFRALPGDEQETIRRIVNRAVARQLLRDIWQVWNHDGASARDALLGLIDADAITSDSQGRPVTALTDTLYWREWYPGLDNGEQTLGDVLDTLPGFDADEVPALVRVFENPASPIALAGAVTLEQHDAIHVLIGRGLVDQDEAFTIGFTAAASKAELTEGEKLAYRVALESYMEPYRVRGRDLLAFDLGVKAARFCQCEHLDQILVAELRNRKLSDLRTELGIERRVLREFYEIEQALIPGTPASLRLPVGG